MLNGLAFASLSISILILASNAIQLTPSNFALQCDSLEFLEPGSTIKRIQFPAGVCSADSDQESFYLSCNEGSPDDARWITYSNADCNGTPSKLQSVRERMTEQAINDTDWRLTCGTNTPCDYGKVRTYAVPTCRNVTDGSSGIITGDYLFLMDQQNGCTGQSTSSGRSDYNQATLCTPGVRINETHWIFSNFEEPQNGYGCTTGDGQLTDGYFAQTCIFGTFQEISCSTAQNTSYVMVYIQTK